MELEIIAVGDDSVGIILPEDVLRHLGIQPGDTLLVKRVPDGFSLSRCSLEDSEKFKAMRRMMRENREVLKMLADS